jgi:type I restriction enzyme S subunit
MKSNWDEVPLGDLVELKRGYDLPTRERTPGKYPIVSSSGVSGTHNRPKVDPPGVVTGRYGTIGNVYFIEEPFWPLNTSLYVRDFKGNNPRFVSYLLQTVNYQSYQDKGAVPGVNRNHLHLEEVLLPPLQEQRRIADILGTLDDKIDLNRKMNRTLEAMARAIFKSWFVDFDPVRAKMSGEDPVGVDPETAEIFPNRLVDSELGEIPEGWSAGQLGDVMKKVTNGCDPTELPPQTPYIGLGDMPEGSIALSNWGHAEDVKSRKYHFERGQILFGRLRPYFRKVGIAPVDGISSTDIQVIVPKEEHWYGFLVCQLSDQEFIDYCTNVSGGTRMPRVKWGDMKKYGIAVAPYEIFDAFGRVISPMLERIVSNLHENRVLSETRETLLPELLSGELDLNRELDRRNETGTRVT